MQEENLKNQARRLYTELQLIVDSMGRDLEKNLTKNNIAAGRRVRSSLRMLRNKSTEFAKSLLENEASKKELGK